MVSKLVKLLVIASIVIQGNFFAKNSYPKKPIPVNFSKVKISKKVGGFALVKNEKASLFFKMHSKKRLVLGFRAAF